jgi:hypothetical protein
MSGVRTKVRAPQTSDANRASRKRKRPVMTVGRRWVAFVEEHGVVLASARGVVPNIAEAVAGEPIVGSWWAHPKGNAIFGALSSLRESRDVRWFKLLDGKITLVHRRMWPAIVRLARDGVLPLAAAADLQQEHMSSGEHRNIVTPFPAWVDDHTEDQATSLTIAEAQNALKLTACAGSSTPIGSRARRPQRSRRVPGTRGARTRG